MASSFPESNTANKSSCGAGTEYRESQLQHLSTKLSHQGETRVRGAWREKKMLLLLDKLYQSTAQFTTKSVHSLLAQHEKRKKEKIIIIWLMGKCWSGFSGCAHTNTRLGHKH